MRGAPRRPAHLIGRRCLSYRARMIFGRSGRNGRKKNRGSGLDEALTALEQGVAARDPERTERAFGATIDALRAAGDAECVAAGPRLAALLPQFPTVGPRRMLATAAGFCVERGADPAACAGPILTAVQEELEAALAFARRWRETVGTTGTAGADGTAGTVGADAELPGADQEIVDDALLARLDADHYAALRLALAWCDLEHWQPPALAVLCRSAGVRRAVDPAVLAAAREVQGLGRHDLKCLVYALAILDGEPLLVLHRPTGTGYEIRIGGIGDNFQLHTLLAHVLIGGGHLPGDAPSAQSVRLATDPAPADGSRSGVVATGAFELLAPDGTRIWNEGLPDDIPLTDGRRVLVLDTPAYRRSWNADRFFPHLPGHAELLRVLPAGETAHWLSRTVTA